MNPTTGATVDDAPALKELCDQQFWLFGRDINRPGGNLLIEAGFERRRFGSGRPTQYVFECPECSISLWGFGLHWICHERDQALFTSRDGEFLKAGASNLLAVRDPWTVERRLRLGEEADSLLAAEVSRWFAEYEAWVLDAAGPDHRVAALEDWDSCCEPCQVAAAWTALSAGFRAARHSARGAALAGSRIAGA